MALETIKYACGHTVKTQMYGSMNDREKKKEWIEKNDCPACETASALKNGKAIKIKYSEFKLLEPLGFSSVYGSYNNDDKTVVVYTKGFKGKTTSAILNEKYAYELRRVAKLQKNKTIQSDLQKAASILENNKNTAYYTNREMELIVSELVRGIDHARVSKILGYDILKKAVQVELPTAPHSREQPDRKKLLFRLSHGNLITTTMPKRVPKVSPSQNKKIKTKIGSPAKPAGQHEIRDMPTIKKKNGRLLKSEEKTRRGYCVPDTVQSYWVLTDNSKKVTPKKKTATQKTTTKKKTTAKKKKQ